MRSHYDSRRESFFQRTRCGKPYDPWLFKLSSEFAEQIAELVVSTRDIVPRTFHQLDELAKEFKCDDPYRDRIAALKGATREIYIAGCTYPPAPIEKLEDEPESKSYQRMEGSFQLFDDFLRDYVKHMNAERCDPFCVRAFKHYWHTWQHGVVEVLEPIAGKYSSEKWLQVSIEYANSADELLRQIWQRIQSTSKSQSAS